MSNLVRYNTPSLLGRSIFDELFGDFQSLARKSTSGYPVADIFSNEDGSTTLEFALAGFSKEDLSIEIQPEKSSLTVRAEANGTGDSNRRIARRSFQKTFVINTRCWDYDKCCCLCTPTSRKAKDIHAVNPVSMQQGQTLKTRSLQNY